MRRQLRFNLLFFISLAIVITLIIISFILFEHKLTLWIDLYTVKFSSSNMMWMLAIFLIAALALDIVLPIPSSVIAVVSATAFGFWIGAGIIWLGLMLSCCAGYLIGTASADFLFRRFTNKSDIIKAQSLAYKIGPGTLVALRGIPVLAETSVIAAGMVRYHFPLFLLICGLSNAGLAMAYGYIGARAGVTNSFLLVVVGCVAVPGGAWLLNWSAHQLKHWLSAPKVNNVAVNNINASFKLSHDYPVLFENKVFDCENPVLRDVLNRTAGVERKDIQKVFVCLDSGLNKANPRLHKQICDYFLYHQRKLNLVSMPLIIPGGEHAKKQMQIETLYQHMMDSQLDRHSCVLIIGGGAVLDAVGFACTTFHRGVKFVRMPSTVLAQNDAGVGVKNGINYLKIKNLIGTFSTPVAVINDASLLKSLSIRDKRAGLAEAVKVAAIRDSTFFAWMEEQVVSLACFEEEASQYAIARCAQLHLQQITQAGDPFESGSARPLDYGHWCAHKLEALAEYQIRHGEAVAIGMVLDARYAVNIGMLDGAEANRLVVLLEGLGFTLWHEKLALLSELGQPLVFSGLEEFRQHLGGELSVTLLRNVGTGEEVHEMDEQRLLEALNWLRHRAETNNEMGSLIPTELTNVSSKKMVKGAF